jgi:hypothetical protein
MRIGFNRAAILKEASNPEHKRIRTFILTMRYSGLRILDATNCEHTP